MSANGMFAGKALDSVPRALGLCDRARGSVTEGCCDRMYWHYRLIDFPNARYQEAGLLFALVYKHDFTDNVFYKKEKMKQWVRAVWKFWLDRRNKDGSVSEAYPFERSFCATSFSSAAFVETVAQLGGADEWKDELQRSENTMRWLASNKNLEVANQMAASALALRGYANLTGDKIIMKYATTRKDETMTMMMEDGAFTEYGGFDTGYQTITLSLLARLLTISGADQRLEDVIRKGEKPLLEKVDSNGRACSSENSRGTQFIYPYGLAAIGSKIIKRLINGLEKNVLINPGWMDDRYFIPLASDYIYADLESQRC